MAASGTKLIDWRRVKDMTPEEIEALQPSKGYWHPGFLEIATSQRLIVPISCRFWTLRPLGGGGCSRGGASIREGQEAPSSPRAASHGR